MLGFIHLPSGVFGSPATARPAARTRATLMGTVRLSKVEIIILLSVRRFRRQKVTRKRVVHRRDRRLPFRRDRNNRQGSWPSIADGRPPRRKTRPRAGSPS